MYALRGNARARVWSSPDRAIRGWLVNQQRDGAYGAAWLEPNWDLETMCHVLSAGARGLQFH